MIFFERLRKSYVSALGVCLLGGVMTVSGCKTMEDALLATDGTNCNINYTVAGSLAGALAGYTASKVFKLDDKETTVLAAGTAVVGGWLGQQKDQACYNRAKQQALDAAAAKYEAAQRAVAAEDAKRQAAINASRRASTTPPTSTTSAQAKPAPTPQRQTKSEPAIPAVAPLSYEELAYKTSSGSEGNIAPQIVYEDQSLNRLCTSRRELLKDSNGKVLERTVTSCRNESGTWVDV